MFTSPVNPMFPEGTKTILYEAIHTGSAMDLDRKLDGMTLAEILEKADRATLEKALEKTRYQKNASYEKSAKRRASQDFQTVLEHKLDTGQIMSACKIKDKEEKLKKKINDGLLVDGSKEGVRKMVEENFPNGFRSAALEEAITVVETKYMKDPTDDAREILGMLQNSFEQQQLQPSKMRIQWKIPTDQSPEGLANILISRHAPKLARDEAVQEARKSWSKRDLLGTCWEVLHNHDPEHANKYPMVKEAVKMAKVLWLLEIVAASGSSYETVLQPPRELLDEAGVGTDVNKFKKLIEPQGGLCQIAFDKLQKHLQEQIENAWSFNKTVLMEKEQFLKQEFRKTEKQQQDLLREARFVTKESLQKFRSLLLEKTGLPGFVYENIKQELENCIKNAMHGSSEQNVAKKKKNILDMAFLQIGALSDHNRKHPTLTDATEKHKEDLIKSIGEGNEKEIHKLRKSRFFEWQTLKQANDVARKNMCLQRIHKACQEALGLKAFNKEKNKPQGRQLDKDYTLDYTLNGGTLNNGKLTRLAPKEVSKYFHHLDKLDKNLETLADWLTSDLLKATEMKTIQKASGLKQALDSDSYHVIQFLLENSIRRKEAEEKKNAVDTGKPKLKALSEVREIIENEGDEISVEDEERVLLYLRSIEFAENELEDVMKECRMESLKYKQTQTKKELEERMKTCKTWENIESIKLVLESSVTQTKKELEDRMKTCKTWENIESIKLVLGSSVKRKRIATNVEENALAAAASKGSAREVHCLLQMYAFTAQKVKEVLNLLEAEGADMTVEVELKVFVLKLAHKPELSNRYPSSCEEEESLITEVSLGKTRAIKNMLGKTIFTLSKLEEAMTDALMDGVDPVIEMLKAEIEERRKPSYREELSLMRLRGEDARELLTNFRFQDVVLEKTLEHAKKHCDSAKVCMLLDALSWRTLRDADSVEAALNRLAQKLKTDDRVGLEALLGEQSFADTDLANQLDEAMRRQTWECAKSLIERVSSKELLSPHLEDAQEMPVEVFELLLEKRFEHEKNCTGNLKEALIRVSELENKADSAAKKNLPKYLVALCRNMGSIQEEHVEIYCKMKKHLLEGGPEADLVFDRLMSMSDEQVFETTFHLMGRCYTTSLPREDFDEKNNFSKFQRDLEALMCPEHARQSCSDMPLWLWGHLIGSVRRFFGRRVRAQVLWFPALPVSYLIRDETLYSLRIASDELLQTKTAYGIVSFAWQFGSALALVDTFFNTLSVVSLAELSRGVRSPQTQERQLGFASSLLVCIIKVVVEEASEYIFRLRRCGDKRAVLGPRTLCVGENLLDLIFLFTQIMGCVFFFEYNITATATINGTEVASAASTKMVAWKRGLLAVTSVSAWGKLLFGLRGYDKVGPRLLPILYATRDTFIFGIVVCGCLAAATHAYYLVGTRQEPHPLYAAVMQIFRLGLFSDFDLFEMEGEDPRWVASETDSGVYNSEDPAPTENYFNIHAIFFLTGIIITIILLNLLIGVLANNYDIYEDLSVALFVRERARLCLNYQTRPWMHYYKKSSSYYKSLEDKYLVMALPIDERNDARSMRSTMAAHFRRQGLDFKKFERNLEKKCDAMGKQLQDFTGRLTKLEELSIRKHPKMHE